MNILPVGIEELAKNKYDLIICTYPRSGVNFLSNMLKENTDINFCYTHKSPINRDNNLTTIIRNPVESISSWVSMGLHFDYIEDRYKDSNLDLYIEGAIRKYLSFYNYIKSSVNFIIDFDDLINNPNAEFLKLLNFFNFTINDNVKSSGVNDDTKNGRISTSKNTMFYDIVTNKIKEYDLEDCNRAFNTVKLTKP